MDLENVVCEQRHKSISRDVGGTWYKVRHFGQTTHPNRDSIETYLYYVPHTRDVRDSDSEFFSRFRIWHTPMCADSELMFSLI